MAYTSTYAQSHSLPNRSPSHRPRALSLSEYQPLAFDREATQAAYRAQLALPSSLSASASAAASSSGLVPASGSGSVSGSGSGSSGAHQQYGVGAGAGAGAGAGGASTETGESGRTDQTGGTFGPGTYVVPRPGVKGGHEPTRAGGYNDDSPLAPPTPVWAEHGSGPGVGPASRANMAGVGAGHSLTPPDSPMHRAAQLVEGQRLGSSDALSTLAHPHPHSQAQAQSPPYSPSLIHASASGTGTGRNGAHALSPIPASPAQELPPGRFGFERRFSRMGVDEALGLGGDGAGSGGGGGCMGMGLGSTGSEAQLVSPLREGMASPAPPPLPSRPHGNGYGGPPVSARQRSTGEDDGWDSDPGYPRYVGQYGGGRMRTTRELPAVPTNVPRPDPPAWEPDYKPHIPDALTQSSAQHAYAQLSAPPPNLPPRPIRPGAGPSTGILNSYASGSTRPSGAPSHEAPVGPSSTGHGPTPYLPRRASSGLPIGSPMHLPTSPTAPLSPLIAGAPDYPPMSPPTGSGAYHQGPNRPPKQPRAAEERVYLRADGRTPIWSTHYIDPALRNTAFSVPGVGSLTNAALAGLAASERKAAGGGGGGAAGGAGGAGTGTGPGAGGAKAGQMDGMARMAKDWFVPPDARFVADRGAIEVGVGVVDAGGSEWGRDKGRKKARVEVVNKTGGIKVDLIEVDEDRQVDLKVECRSGDVLVLLPEDFFGEVHVTSLKDSPHFCHLVSENQGPVSRSHAHDASWWTVIVPAHISTLAAQAGAVTSASPATAQLEPASASLVGAGHSVAGKTGGGGGGGGGARRFMQDFIRSEAAPGVGLMSAYAAFAGDAARGTGTGTGQKGEWSKVFVNAGKGRVVFAYRETEDEGEVGGLVPAVKVGVQKEKRKRWWSR